MQEAQRDEVVQQGTGAADRAAGQRGGGLRVDEPGRGEGEQAQHPGGGSGQGGVGEAEDPAQRRALVVLGAQLLGEIGDGRLGAGVPGQQLHPGLGVQAAQRAGADVRDAGQRAHGDRDDQAVRGVGQECVDLLGVGRVVQQEQGPAVGQGGAQGVGEVVFAGSGRGVLVQGGEQVPGGPLDGHGGAVGVGQAGAQEAVRVAVGDLPSEFLGECGAAGAGPAGDEQHPRAWGLATCQGVQSGALDVGAQFLQLPRAAEESTVPGCVPGQPHVACLHDLIRHGPHSRPPHLRARRDSGTGVLRA